MSVRVLAAVTLAIAKLKRDGLLPIRGEKGDKGDQGDPADEQRVADLVAPRVQEYVRENVVLFRGAPGPKGDRGPAPDAEPIVESLLERVRRFMLEHAIVFRGERGPKGDSVKGDRGERGERGETGKGAKGDKGDKGDPGLMWRGLYKPGRTYNQDDAVFWMGSSWVARRRTDGEPGRSPSWDMLAQKGADGVSFGGGGDGGGGISQAQLDAAIAAHEAANDPHSAYLKQAEADALYDAIGAAADGDAAHVGASDPHTQYQRESEKNAAGGYAGLDGSSKLAGAQQTYGVAANTACEGNDGRLSDARTPTTHASSHQAGGGDAIKLDDLAAPDDNTDLDASTAKHGLMKKFPGGTTDFLRADGTFAAPTASVAAPFTGNQAPGSFTIADGQFGIQGKRLKLTGSQRATIQGSGRLSVIN